MSINIHCFYCGLFHFQIILVVFILLQTFFIVFLLLQTFFIVFLLLQIVVVLFILSELNHVPKVHTFFKCIQWVCLRLCFVSTFVFISSFFVFLFPFFILFSRRQQVCTMTLNVVMISSQKKTLFKKKKCSNSFSSHLSSFLNSTFFLI